jgi:hypothetical protein
VGVGVDWSRRDRLSYGALGALAGLQVAVFAFVLWKTQIRTPFEDMLQWLHAYQRYRHGGDLTTYLFGFFQEHRLVWMKLLTAVDASVFRSSGVMFIAVGTLATVGIAVLLTREVMRGLTGRGPVTALAWLCPMLVLTAPSGVDCSVPVNAVYPLTVLFVVGACVLFDGRGEAAGRVGVRRCVAVVLAAAAGLANAVGLLAWPVLLWSAWRGRAGPRWLIAIAVVGGGYGLAYLSGLPLPSGAVAPSAPDAVAKLFFYVFAYLGLPLSRLAALRVAGEAWGAMLVAAGVAAVIRVGLVARQATRLERIATGLILFSVGGAVLAALGRSGYAAEIPVRYTVLVIPLHVGLLALVLDWVGGRPVMVQRPGVVLACGIAAGVVLLAQQVVVGRSAIVVAATMRGTIDRFYAGVHDPDIQRLVFQSGLDQADAIVADLRRDGLLAR